MKKIFCTFFTDESGTTAIEYGILAGLIGIAIVGAITQSGGTLNAFFTHIADKLAEANNRA